MLNRASRPLPQRITVFSSAGSHPFQLVSSFSSDRDLKEDSFLALVQDHSDEIVEPNLKISDGGRFIRPLDTESYKILSTPTSGSDDADSNYRKGDIISPVLHIQGPSVRSTFITFGSSSSSDSDRKLGIPLAFVHFSLKNLGKLYMLEVGIEDRDGTVGRIRASTFQVKSFYLRVDLH
jgi:hypothetical protein